MLKQPLTIQPALLAQEADFSVRVAPDEADDDGFLFAPLEPVHAAQFNARELILEWGEDRKLSFIRDVSSQLVPSPFCLSGVMHDILCAAQAVWRETCLQDI